MMKNLTLLKRLAPYVSEDDVDLSHLTFLRMVADRINDDIVNANTTTRSKDHVFRSRTS